MHLNLISLFGLFVMMLLAWLVSSHRWKVNWRLVTIGVLCQATLAAALFKSQDWTFAQQFSNTQSLLAAFENKTLSAEQIDASLANRKPSKFSIKTIQTSLENDATKLAHWDARLFPPTSTGAPTLLEIPRYENGILFSAVNSVFISIDAYVKEGSNFVFRGHDGDTTLLKAFVFNILPTVIFFASLMAVLYHIGFMQRLVTAMAWGMQKTLGTSGAESMAAAANVMVGHTEAPLMIRPYIQNMTRSDLAQLGLRAMFGGMLAACMTASLAGIMYTAPN